MEDPKQLGRGLILLGLCFCALVISFGLSAFLLQFLAGIPIIGQRPMLLVWILYAIMCCVLYVVYTKLRDKEEGGGKKEEE